MIENSELLRVPAFVDLPEDQIAWFISQSQELLYKTGDTYARQGDPAEAMYVILEGQIEIRGELNGEMVAFPISGGHVTSIVPGLRGRRVQAAASMAAIRWVWGTTFALET